LLYGQPSHLRRLLREECLKLHLLRRLNALLGHIMCLDHSTLLRVALLHHHVVLLNVFFLSLLLH
jgi:hypothetical protein